MAFSYKILGETAGVGGQKRIFGTWNSASVTTGTITWNPSTSPYNVVGGGAVYSTTQTTAGLPSPIITAGTMVLTTTDSGAQGYWWVDVQ